MSDLLRLTIHESAVERCVAKCVHRSGSRIRPISFNDVLYGSDNETPCGVVVSVGVEKIDRENYLYRVSYIPSSGTLHPIDSFVIWRQPVSESPASAPPATTNRLEKEQTLLVPTGVNGKKRNRKKSVNGQQGLLAQASADNATANV